MPSRIGWLTIKENKILHYIIFDMEWNQAFSAEKMVKHPVVLRGEIIQIGAVKLNEQKEVTDTCNLII